MTTSTDIAVDKADLSYRSYEYILVHASASTQLQCYCDILKKIGQIQ
jgi:hypothetical protein